MITKRTSLIITTINKPNKVINKYLSICSKHKVDYVIIGDKKTPSYPKKYSLISTQTQKKLNFKIIKKLPYNSYSRKNIGYLLAMKKKTEIIIETDDDNYPKSNFFENLALKKKIIQLSGPKWINILSVLGEKKVKLWPRGYPLSLINKKQKLKKKLLNICSPVQQRMIEGNPDVDAIFRLSNQLKFYKFKKENYSIDSKSICPFNTQNTVWHKIAFPLMYLPSYCTMRSTDIWRGFIALRVLKNYNWNLSFLSPTVIQERNEHDLMNDFDQEIPIYRDTILFNNILENTKLNKRYDHMLINFYKCYKALVKYKIIDPRELILLRAWLQDIKTIYPDFKKI